MRLKAAARLIKSAALGEKHEPTLDSGMEDLIRRTGFSSYRNASEITQVDLRASPLSEPREFEEDHAINCPEHPSAAPISRTEQTGAFALGTRGAN